MQMVHMVQVKKKKLLKGRTQKIKHPELLLLLANGRQKKVIGVNQVYGK